MPDEILGSNYEFVYGVLDGYKKSHMEWDDYVHRAKLGQSERNLLRDIFSELRENGFYVGYLSDGKIIFEQVTERKEKRKVKGIKVTLRMDGKDYWIREDLATDLITRNRAVRLVVKEIEKGLANDK